jgi:hypothetical protein
VAQRARDIQRARRALAYRRVLAALVLSGLAACGGAPRTPDDKAGPPRPPAGDARTPIEQRRDVACEQLGPRITACAVEDAKAELAAGKIQKSQFDLDTAPAVQRRNTEEFVEACRATATSSRQVRVLEVCFQEARLCGALLDCLGHLTDTGSTKDRSATPP